MCHGSEICNSYIKQTTFASIAETLVQMLKLVNARNVDSASLNLLNKSISDSDSDVTLYINSNIYQSLQSMFDKSENIVENRRCLVTAMSGKSHR